MQDSPNLTAAANLESLEHSTVFSESSAPRDYPKERSDEEDDLIFDIAELGLFAPQPHDSDTDSNFSLDYEYIGPRHAKYANSDDESVASEMSAVDGDSTDIDHTFYDMWDEDIYSTNDYTWESNDMRLSLFIKRHHKRLQQLNVDTAWEGKSFWRKDRGWPMQMQNSCSTTNHDQSAGTLCLVKSDLAVSECLMAFYKDRIVRCGGHSMDIASQDEVMPVPPSNTGLHSRDTLAPYLETIAADDTTADIDSLQTDGKPSSVFLQTHASIQVPASDVSIRNSNDRHRGVDTPTLSIMEQCVPYTKFLKRSDFVPPSRDSAYVALGFEPLCMDHNYGYMALGGLEGELLVFCCADSENPVKIWGTKFKRRNNVMLMTNSIQIVRWRRQDGSFKHMLIACMNEAGVLVYNLPPHSNCEQLARNFSKPYTRSSRTGLTLHSHLQDFQHSPINDACVSPDGSKIVFVGDDSYIFLRDINTSDDPSTSGVEFGPAKVLTIPTDLLSPYSSHTPTTSANDIPPDQPYSSQHVAWSHDSTLFAHTSDSHYCVLVWTVETQELVMAIDAAGYSYAISFHPTMRNILTFSNRYGYFHTVDLEQATSINDGRICIENPLLTVESKMNIKSITERSKAIFPRQEITMVSFRGEQNTKLRILAKINGLQWSASGRYLYIATKKRVLVYEFMNRGVRKLVELAGEQARKILELDPIGWRTRERLTTHFQSQIMLTRKRKRLLEESINYEPWYRKWKQVPDHLRTVVLGDNMELAHHD